MSHESLNKYLEYVDGLEWKVHEMEKENKSLKHRCESEEMSKNYAWDLHKELDKINAKYLAESNKHKQALEWYADKETYSRECLSQHGYIPIDQDNGERARQALKEETE